MCDDHGIGLCDCMWLIDHVVSMDYWCVLVCGSVCVAVVGGCYVYCRW